MTKHYGGSRDFEARPARGDFAARYRQGKAQVVWTRLVADLETPVSAMLKLGEGRAMSCLLESIEGGAARGRYSIIGLAPDVVWRTNGERAEINRAAHLHADRFETEATPALQSLRALLAESLIELPPELPPIAAGVIGYLGHDTVRLVERLPNQPPDALGVPDGMLVRPTLMVVFDNVKDEMIVVTPVRPEVRPRSGPRPSTDAHAAYEGAVERLRSVVEALDAPLPHTTAMAGVQLALPEPVSNTTPADYMGMVERAKAYIAAGDIFQVVLAQRFSVPFSLPPFALYRALRRTNPSPFLFYLDYGAFALVGSSPEILVRVRSGEVTIRPLAGTRRRGATTGEDKALEAELLVDPKERAEHLMLLDLGRNDVGRVAEIGSVRVTESFAVERYSHVMHIVSHIVARLRDGKNAFDAIRATFPAGTVSGAPKIRAMQIIADLEKARRGFYAGIVGYFGFDGSHDSCIAIRSIILKDGKAYLQTGAGIVADSDPTREFDECVNKAKAMLTAIARATKKED